MLLSTIRQHGPDLILPSGSSLKYEMTAIRRPAWKIVAPGVMRQLNPLQRRNVHHINVLPTWCSRAVFAIPRESQKLPAWRPRRRHGIATIRHGLNIAAIGIHDVNLWQPGASAHPGYL